MAKKVDLDETTDRTPSFFMFTTSNTSWLEDVFEGRSNNPEEILSELEDRMERGEITERELRAHYGK